MKIIKCRIKNNFFLLKKICYVAIKKNLYQSDKCLAQEWYGNEENGLAKGKPFSKLVLTLASCLPTFSVSAVQD